MAGDLSKIDLSILHELQGDGRITYSELANKVGLSTSPCIERVKKLERSGYITGYTATLNSALLDAGLIVFVMIRLDHTSKDNFEEFRQAVRFIPAVQECHLTTGAFDYLIKARVKDMNEYRILLEENLLAIPHVKESTSIVAMDTVKETLRLGL
ncbi:MAG: Lrp/AsnC ligand binding domain-containing protein [Arenicella sp.]